MSSISNIINSTINNSVLLQAVQAAGGERKQAWSVTNEAATAVVSSPSAAISVRKVIPSSSSSNSSSAAAINGSLLGHVHGYLRRAANNEGSQQLSDSSKAASTTVSYVSGEVYLAGDSSGSSTTRPPLLALSEQKLTTTKLQQLSLATSVDYDGTVLWTTAKVTSAANTATTAVDSKLATGKKAAVNTALVAGKNNGKKKAALNASTASSTLISSSPASSSSPGAAFSAPLIFQEQHQRHLPCLQLLLYERTVTTTTSSSNSSSPPLASATLAATMAASHQLLLANSSSTTSGKKRLVGCLALDLAWLLTSANSTPYTVCLPILPCGGRGGDGGGPQGWMVLSLAFFSSSSSPAIVQLTSTATAQASLAARLAAASSQLWSTIVTGDASILPLLLLDRPVAYASLSPSQQKLVTAMLNRANKPCNTLSWIYHPQLAAYTLHVTLGSLILSSLESKLLLAIEEEAQLQAASEEPAAAATQQTLSAYRIELRLSTNPSQVTCISGRDDRSATRGGESIAILWETSDAMIDLHTVCCQLDAAGGGGGGEVGIGFELVLYKLSSSSSSATAADSTVYAGGNCCLPLSALQHGLPINLNLALSKRYNNAAAAGHAVTKQAYTNLDTTRIGSLGVTIHATTTTSTSAAANQPASTLSMTSASQQSLLTLTKASPARRSKKQLAAGAAAVSSSWEPEASLHYYLHIEYLEGNISDLVAGQSIQQSGYTAQDIFFQARCMLGGNDNSSYDGMVSRSGYLSTTTSSSSLDHWKLKSRLTVPYPELLKLFLLSSGSSSSLDASASLGITVHTAREAALPLLGMARVALPPSLFQLLFQQLVPASNSQQVVSSSKATGADPYVQLKSSAPYEQWINFYAGGGSNKGNSSLLAGRVKLRVTCCAADRRYGLYRPLSASASQLELQQSQVAMSNLSVVGQVGIRLLGVVGNSSSAAGNNDINLQSADLDPIMHARMKNTQHYATSAELPREEIYDVNILQAEYDHPAVKAAIVGHPAGIIPPFVGHLVYSTLGHPPPSIRQQQQQRIGGREEEGGDGGEGSYSEIAIEAKTETSLSTYLCTWPLFKAFPIYRDPAAAHQTSLELPLPTYQLPASINSSSGAASFGGSMSHNSSALLHRHAKTTSSEGGLTGGGSIQSNKRLVVQCCMIPYLQGVLHVQLASSSPLPAAATLRCSMGRQENALFTHLTVPTSSVSSSNVGSLAVHTRELLDLEEEDGSAMLPLVCEVFVDNHLATTTNAAEQVHTAAGSSQGGAGAALYTGSVYTAALYMLSLQHIIENTSAATTSSSSSGGGGSSSSGQHQLVWYTAPLTLYPTAAAAAAINHSQPLITWTLRLAFEVQTLAPHVIEYLKQQVYLQSSNNNNKKPDKTMLLLTNSEEPLTRQADDDEEEEGRSKQQEKKKEMMRLELSLKQAFLLADKDQSGSIDQAEFAALLQLHHATQLQQQQQLAGSAAQPQMIGLEDIQQIVDLLAFISYRPANNDDDAEDEGDEDEGDEDQISAIVQDVFNLVDIEQDGSLSWYEWQALLFCLLYRKQHAHSKATDAAVPPPLDTLLILYFAAFLALTSSSSSTANKQQQVAVITAFPAGYFMEELHAPSLQAKQAALQAQLLQTMVDQYGLSSQQAAMAGGDDLYSDLDPAAAAAGGPSSSKLAKRLHQLVKSLRLTNNSLAKRLEEALVAAQSINNHDNQSSQQLVVPMAANSGQLPAAHHILSKVDALEQSSLFYLKAYEELRQQQQGQGSSPNQQPQPSLPLLLHDAQEAEEMQRLIAEQEASLQRKRQARSVYLAAVSSLARFLVKFVRPFLRRLRERRAGRLLYRHLGHAVRQRRRRFFKKHRDAAARQIQRHYRGHADRRFVQQRQRASQDIQRLYRGRRGRSLSRQKRADRAARLAAARLRLGRLLLSMYRGYKTHQHKLAGQRIFLAMKAHREKLEQQRLVKLQSEQHRLAVRHMSAVKTLQTAVRRWLARRHGRHHLQQLRYLLFYGKQRSQLYAWPMQQLGKPALGEVVQVTRELGYYLSSHHPQVPALIQLKQPAPDSARRMSADEQQYQPVAVDAVPRSFWLVDLHKHPHHVHVHHADHHRDHHHNKDLLPHPHAYGQILEIDASTRLMKVQYHHPAAAAKAQPSAVATAAAGKDCIVYSIIAYDHPHLAWYASFPPPEVPARQEEAAQEVAEEEEEESEEEPLAGEQMEEEEELEEEESAIIAEEEEEESADEEDEEEDGDFIPTIPQLLKACQDLQQQQAAGTEGTAAIPLAPGSARSYSSNSSSSSPSYWVIFSREGEEITGEKGIIVAVKPTSLPQLSTAPVVDPAAEQHKQQRVSFGQDQQQQQQHLLGVHYGHVLGGIPQEVQADQHVVLDKDDKDIAWIRYDHPYLIWFKRTGKLAMGGRQGEAEEEERVLFKRRNQVARL